MKEQDFPPSLLISLLPRPGVDPRTSPTRDAARLVDALASRGVPLADVSVALRFSRAQASAGFDGFIPPDDASGPIGSLPEGLRSLRGWGALVLPETGRLLAAGPVLSAIAATAVCPWGGSVVRALVTLGLDAAAAQKCVSALAEGAVLVAVRSDDPRVLSAAETVLGLRESGVRLAGSLATFAAA